MYYVNNMVKKLKKCNQLIVFGAGNIGCSVINCLHREPYSLQIAFCMVSEEKNNPKEIEGVPVVTLKAAEGLVAKDAWILVAVVEQYLEEIERELHQRGFSNILPLTSESDLWSFLRGNSYLTYQNTRNQAYLTLEEELQREKTIRVYRACCHVDRELREDLSRYSWEIPIQVGASLTKERICEVCDNTGEHISEKNRQYCELTALYWIWKNDTSDYVGLCHYRRHFELDREQLKMLSASDIDVVLTIPFMNGLGVEAVYRRMHVARDWDIMLKAVRKLSPEYIKASQEMCKGRFYYAYNMFIMRREVLEDYCAWLFPILSYCEEHCEEKEDSYQNRYIGFLAERLMTVYFLYHEGRYKIVHAKKHFVER